MTHLSRWFQGCSLNILKVSYRRVLYSHIVWLRTFSPFSEGTFRDIWSLPGWPNKMELNLLSLLSGSQATYGSMHQLPGGWAGRGGPGPGQRPHFLCLCKGGSPGSCSEGPGNAWSRYGSQTSFQKWSIKTLKFLLYIECPLSGGALAEGFQARMFEFQNFERRFEVRSSCAGSCGTLLQIHPIYKTKFYRF